MTAPVQLALLLPPSPRARPFEPTQDPTELGWWDGQGSEHTIQVVKDKQERL